MVRGLERTVSGLNLSRKVFATAAAIGSSAEAFLAVKGPRTPDNLRTIMFEIGFNLLPALGVTGVAFYLNSEYQRLNRQLESIPHGRPSTFAEFDQSVLRLQASLRTAQKSP